jgi:hypothetical protein
LVEISGSDPIQIFPSPNGPRLDGSTSRQWTLNGAPLDFFDRQGGLVSHCGFGHGSDVLARPIACRGRQAEVDLGSIARRCWTAIVAVIALTLASGWNVAAGQNLVGTWKLISETVQHGDQTDQPFGESPLGLMMVDSGGRFMLLISRPDLPRIEANRRDAGTPEENKTILTGTLAFFGSYKVSMPNGLLTIRVEAGTFPNWIGTDQKRFFTLAGDDMTWINRAPAVSGETPKLVWKRQKAE